MADDKRIAVRVALRSRPLVEKEISEGCQNCLTFNANEAQVIAGQDKVFTFDYAFPIECNQETLYKTAIADRINFLFKGYNVTVLAYGQTGSGKTHTMGTSYTLSGDGDDSNCGVIQRAVKDIFDGINERSPEAEFVVKVSFLEVYKEDVFDLLQKNKEPIAIREDQDGIKLVGLTEQSVASDVETFEALEQGCLSRTTASTAMNARSSRSHAIFTIILEQRSTVDVTDIKKAKFHLVDLAGSERAHKTGTSGDRFKEGVNINRGLLALGNVISSLCDESSHVPYRDSKLTRLLQDSLGGNSHTVMIACVSPADSNLDETINTLRYAYRARKIKNKPIVNRDPQNAELKHLKLEVQKLQLQLLQSQNGSTVSPKTHAKINEDMKFLVNRNKYLEVDNQRLAKELHHALNQTTNLCEKALKDDVDKDYLIEQLLALEKKTNEIVAAFMEIFNDDPAFKEQVQHLKDLQNEIVKIQCEQAKKKNIEISIFTSNKQCEAVETGDFSNTSSGESDEDTPNDENFHKSTLKQAAMSRELEELDRALALKQEMASKMLETDSQMTVMRIQFESNIKQMEDEITNLQNEKEGLANALKAAQATSNASRVSEQRRRRLQELEGKIANMKKEIQEKSRILKMKQDAERKVNQLQQEITNMKSIRVKLLKQMREESERYRNLKLQKDREVAQLKQKDRKRQYEITKLKDEFKKQNTVLKRKMEEATAANRRLNVALQQQKSVAERRAKEKQHVAIGVGTRVQQWLSQEIEVLMSSKEAQHHLKGLMEDRKTIVEQINLLQKSIETAEPPSKKRASDGDDVDTDENAETLVEIDVLQKEFELRNLQIAELQQQISDADQEEKSKHRWDTVQSMVESKCAMKYLFEQVIESKFENFLVSSDCIVQKDKASADIQKLRKRVEAEAVARERAEKAAQKIKRAMVSKTCELDDKVLYLLRQVNAANSSNPSIEENGVQLEMKQFQEKEIERLSYLSDSLKKKNEQIEFLKAELQKAKYASYDKPSLPNNIGIEKERNAKKENSNKTFLKDKSGMEIYLIDDDDEDGDINSDHETSFDNIVKDPDFRGTPMHKRVKSQVSCNCKISGCVTRHCKCHKNVVACSDLCGCSEICNNRVKDQSNSTHNNTYTHDPEAPSVLKEINNINNFNDSEDFAVPASRNKHVSALKDDSISFLNARGEKRHQSVGDRPKRRLPPIL